jgi:hypothetical protein
MDLVGQCVVTFKSQAATEESLRTSYGLRAVYLSFMRRPVGVRPTRPAAFRKPHPVLSSSIEIARCAMDAQGNIFLVVISCTFHRSGKMSRAWREYWSTVSCQT